MQNFLSKLKQISRIKRVRYEHEILTQQNALMVEYIEQLSLSMLGAQKEKENVDVLCSFTSYGERVQVAHITALSLLTQSVTPQSVILWLDKEEYEEDSLPEQLKMLVPFGLSIRFCKNLRSYKKLIPTLKCFPDRDIATFDDDIIYPNDHLERLVNTSRRYPKSVVCHLAHCVTTDRNSQPKPYEKWRYHIESIQVDEQSNDNVVPIGLGGVLYPRGSLAEEVIDDELFLEACPNADDLWFKCMALKNKTSTVIVPDTLSYREYIQIPGTQEKTLWQSNIRNNNQQLSNILRLFPEIRFK
ncbi:hypothetical protein ACFSJY_18210 [Thalassotalea euphylliae]|uniref:hypothetical protein n=1 Tax=Thalassotalea euphylliae TaxID=1655234 RepID=UPI00362CC74F